MQNNYTVLGDVASSAILKGRKPVKLSTFANFKKNVEKLMNEVSQVSVEENTPNTIANNFPVQPVTEAPQTREVSVASPAQEEPVNNQVVAPIKEELEKKINDIGLTVYGNEPATVIDFKGAKRLRVNPLVVNSVKGTSVLAIEREVFNVEPEQTVENPPEPSNEISQDMEITPRETKTTFDFSSLSNIKPETEVEETTYHSQDDRLNDYLNGNLSASLDLDQYKKELEDLDGAKADLQEMSNNVEACKEEISELQKIIANQRKNAVLERQEVSKVLSDKTAEYRDLRAQIIEMKELIERNNNAVSTFDNQEESDDYGKSMAA